MHDASDAHLLVGASVAPAPAPAPVFVAMAPLSIASQPVLPAGIPYYLDVIARTGDQSLLGFGDQPSINDSGKVAFVGRFVDGEGIFVGDHASLVNINPHFSHTLDRVFDRTVQINNSGQVLARDRISGGPAIAHVRIWDGADFAILASGGVHASAVASSRAQFQSDGRFTLFNATAAETGGPTGHVELTRNIGVQRFIFDTLGLRHTNTDIATELGASPNAGNVLSALIDPVEAIIVDGQGRRVGFSSAEGVLAEIPGSSYAASPQATVPVVLSRPCIAHGKEADEDEP